jgi:SOS-response transcriptional repressor LexA
VDLFSEGVDIPAVDTILMLRPTESPVLFLQQLGRGLRRAPGKDHLVVLDFIGNHRAFLNRPQALFQASNTAAGLRNFTEQVRSDSLELPPGCFANYDLRFIEFLENLIPGNPGEEYENLKAGLGRRPTAAEAYRAGLSMTKLRKEGGHWWAFLEGRGDLAEAEARCVAAHGDFLQEVETTAMNKSFKMVLLEALLELDGFRQPPTLEALTAASAEIFRRRPSLLADLPPELQDAQALDGQTLAAYWRKNPIYFWTKGDKGPDAQRWFVVEDERFRPTFSLDHTVEAETFTDMVQELVDYRLARYQPSQATTAETGQVIPFPSQENRTELPYYPDLGIACGHFRTSRAEAEERVAVPPGSGRLDPERHFVVRASGDSMNGGKHPIRDGDYLLLEWVTQTSAGSITGETMAIERQDGAGDTQYLLRGITKTADGRYILKAQNPDYGDLEADESMRTFARLQAVLDPLELAKGETFQREDIPALFDATFNQGAWNSGHVVLSDRTHILLVTLNKQGKQDEHRYLDYFIDDQTFHWQSQNKTTPESKRGREIVEQAQRGTEIHLFVRDQKLRPDGRSAPFRYLGTLDYVSHEGSAPMGVTFRLKG